MLTDNKGKRRKLKNNTPGKWWCFAIDADANRRCDLYFLFANTANLVSIVANSFFDK
jgi:hypothetical protein